MALDTWNALTDQQRAEYARQLFNAPPSPLLDIAMPPKMESWFAWRPVRLHSVGDTFYLRNRPWTWLRRIKRSKMTDGHWFYRVDKW